MKEKHREIVVNVQFVPANTLPDEPLYIAGDFNNWNPCDESYRLTQNGGGTYGIRFRVTKVPFEYKFTRGSWIMAECDKTGNFLDNRVFTLKDRNPVHVQIKNWADRRETKSDNVTVMDDHFYIPQLERYRQIWLYLPPDYEANNKRYPVIYMHDGQNLFSEYFSFAGEWAVDKTLNRFYQQKMQCAIVVGIENGGHLRYDEYVPWRTRKPFCNDTADYAAFIVDTLKPYMDSRYRTLPDRDNTAMIGSSFGALISFYTGITYAHVFSKLGLFSPSFWESDQLNNFIGSVDKKHKMKLYFVAGGKESTLIIKNMQQVYNMLEVVGFTHQEMKLTVASDGEHNEWFWQREFPVAYQWLFGL